MQLVGLDGDVEVDIIDQARIRSRLQDPASLAGAVATRKELVAVQPHAHGHAVAGLFAGHLQRFEQEAHPVLEAAAVFVGPAVEVRREKLLDQRAVRAWIITPSNPAARRLATDCRNASSIARISRVDIARVAIPFS